MYVHIIVVTAMLNKDSCSKISKYSRQNRAYVCHTELSIFNWIYSYLHLISEPWFQKNTIKYLH